MFDENDCINCGKSVLGHGLYCSEKCRLQDSGDHSTSNSSVAPSSASSSPSRTSSQIGRAQQPSRRGNGYGVQSKRHSKISSEASSPSLHTSDLPEFSDDDMAVAIASERKAHVTRDSSPEGNPFRRPEKAMDHAFWKSRYAEFGAATPTLDHDITTGSSRSVPGGVTALHYARKPGPINGNVNVVPSRLHAEFSPLRNVPVHKRYGSEHAFPGRLLRVDSSTRLQTSEKIQRHGSVESAASSTPRSKSAIALPSSATKLHTAHSESTLGTSATRPSGTVSAVAPRHVSDTLVHTLRRSLEPLTAVAPLSNGYPSSHRAYSRTESLALSALKDVARSHGMMGPNMKTGEYRSRHPEDPTQAKESGLVASSNSIKTDETQEAAFRGRSRNRSAASRSPSPPKWAEEEPAAHRRGRSARREL